VNANAQAHTAIWALTPNGARLAGRIAGAMPGSILLLHAKVAATVEGAMPFVRLKDEIKRQFNAHSQHIFIMATGIVVRTIAALLRHKTVDPAVVVVDDQGRFAAVQVAEGQFIPLKADIVEKIQVIVVDPLIQEDRPGWIKGAVAALFCAPLETESA
jgi:hypothetical protein